MYVMNVSKALVIFFNPTKTNNFFNYVLSKQAKLISFSMKSMKGLSTRNGSYDSPDLLKVATNL